MAGTAYDVTFWLQNVDSSSNNRFGASFGSVTLVPEATQSAFGYTQFTFTNVIPGANADLHFIFYNPPSYFYLDDVCVTVSGGGGSPTPTATPTGSPSCTPIVVNGSIDTSDPTQIDRLFRSGVPQTCPASTTCATFGDGLPRHYDSYAFTNTTGATQCVTIDTNTACTGTNFIFIGAYLDSFDPNNICTNWIGDSGSSPNPDKAFQVDVDDGQTLVVVVSEVTPDAGCPAYTVTITGLCGRGTPSPTPTATATATVTPTPTPTSTPTPTPCTGRCPPTPRPRPTPVQRPTPAPHPTPTPPGAWTLGQWYQWTNGHYYSVQAITGPDNSWPIARTQARALTAPDGSACDLATVTSADENDFIFAGIDDPTYWAIDGSGNNEGPNLGGFQYAKLAEPAGDWIWVTGEPWSFTQWNPGEPDNSGGDEDALTYFATGSARSSNWNDISLNDGSVIHYYVAESTGLTCTPTPAGLVSWWPGDANANDIQGSNNGTLQNNASIWPSLVDQGFSFTGGSDRVFIADSPSLAITASLTLDAWVNAASPPPNGIGDIIFRGDDRPFLDPYTLRMVGSNVRFQISDAAGNIAYVEAPLPLNQFVLVAGTLDDATGVMTLYLNGTVAAQTTTTVRPYGILTGANPGVSIGNLQSDTTLEPFVGLIDEVEIFNRALDPSEVLAIYNAGNSGKCKP